MSATIDCILFAALICACVTVNAEAGDLFATVAPRVTRKRSKALDTGCLHQAGDARDVSNHTAIFALRRLGSAIRRFQIETSVPTWCDLRDYGEGAGAHKLCNVSSYTGESVCVFLSFGIATDSSFDSSLIKEHNCYGLAFDPSVSYLSDFLGDHAPFLAVGAKVLGSGSFVAGEWFLADVPLLARALSIDGLQVLKMDCEGCEYALAESVQKNDPCFFYKIDQFAVEVHISKVIAQTRSHVLGLGRLARLLEAAGLDLVHAELGPCNDEHARAGVLDDFRSLDYPSALDNYCQNLLFARHSVAGLLS